MKTIYEMAREAGFSVGPSRDGPDDVWGVGSSLERFAALVREDEREACAKVMLSIANADAGNPYKQALRMGAEAIRARSNT